MHATISKGNVGYDQYTAPDDCSCRTYFCCFPLAFANTFPWPFVPILSNSLEKKRTQNHPQCLSGLSRAVFLTTFLEIAVFSSSQCPLLPASQHFHQDEGRNKDRAKRAKKSYALRNLNFNEESRQMGRPQIDSDFVFY